MQHVHDKIDWVHVQWFACVSRHCGMAMVAARVLLLYCAAWSLSLTSFD
jgi:hypothetical protein